VGFPSGGLTYPNSRQGRGFNRFRYPLTPGASLVVLVLIVKAELCEPGGGIEDGAEVCLHGGEDFRAVGHDTEHAIKQGYAGHLGLFEGFLYGSGWLCLPSAGGSLGGVDVLTRPAESVNFIEDNSPPDTPQ
jgi:hypothetical protein